jgi:ATP-dependent RNA helicase DDX24/MAK5
MAIIGNPWAQDAAAFGQGTGQALSQGLLQLPQQRYMMALQNAQMQQRQRLNNLDRFKATDESVLIASDVAARGIDIVGVDHVIHFHLPKGKETYVHRCGRTARANQSGTTLALVSPEERKLADICALNSTRPDVIQYTPNARDARDFIIPILKLARSIERAEHSIRSARSEINWAQKLADECELVLDEDNDPSYKKRQEQAQRNPKVQAREIEISKSRLKQLLDQFYGSF